MRIGRISGLYKWIQVDESPSWDCRLCSDPIDWYKIPNYDDSSGSASFVFLIELTKRIIDPRAWPHGSYDKYFGDIAITFSVTTDENGIRPVSMSASADDSDGNSYDITVYYRYGTGGDFEVLSE